MQTYWIRIRDWWRGYTDADVLSLQVKWQEGQSKPPGSLIMLTRGENKALCAGEDVWGSSRPRWTVTLTTAATIQRDP